VLHAHCARSTATRAASSSAAAAVAAASATASAAAARSVVGTLSRLVPARRPPPIPPAATALCAADALTTPAIVACNDACRRNQIETQAELNGARWGLQEGRAKLYTQRGKRNWSRKSDEDAPVQRLWYTARANATSARAHSVRRIPAPIRYLVAFGGRLGPFATVPITDAAVNLNNTTQTALPCGRATLCVALFLKMQQL